MTSVRWQPDRWKAEVQLAAEVALSVGATEPLEFIGIGMQAVTLLGSEGHCWKVPYRDTASEVHDVVIRMQEDEAEWLEAAQGLSFAPVLYRWHPELLVIERQYVQSANESYSSGWAPWGFDRSRFWREVEAAMLPLGWTAPEQKDDALVYSSDGPKVVDAGMAHRVGARLLDYVLECVDGLRPWHRPWNDLAWDIHIEVSRHSMSPEAARPVLDRLLQAGATMWTD